MRERIILTQTWFKRSWFKIAAPILALALIGGIGYQFWWGYTRLPFIDRAPDWTLTNAVTGQAETFSTLGPNVKLVEFIYLNCPDICPATTINMVQIQNELKKQNVFGSQVKFVSITFDPERDTPAALKNYASKLKMDLTGWNMYRGSVADTQKVLKDFNIFAEKQSDGFFIHPTNSLFLVDKNNNVRKIYTMGQDMQNDQIIKDIIQLTKD